MKTYISLLAAAVLMAGCSSVSERIPTVKIEKRQPKVVAQPATHVQTTHSVQSSQPSYTHTPQSAYVQSASTTSTATPEEAARVCETSAMRKMVVDGDDSNDIVRIMTVQDTVGNSQLLSEMEVNCRDYFLRKTLSSSNNSPLIQTSASTRSTSTPQTITRSRSNSRYTYIVQRGDTVWDIARQHCTSAKAISRLNGLGRGNVIDIGQRIKLPDTDCN